MKNDIKFYIDVLKSDACACERSKKVKAAFCYACFKRLPAHMQSALYHKINAGFEQAYDAAYRYLYMD